MEHHIGSIGRPGSDEKSPNLRVRYLNYVKDSVRLVNRCHKPDRKEASKVAVRAAIGFVVMGFVDFFVKLIFIPINNIIVGPG